MRLLVAVLMATLLGAARLAAAEELVREIRLQGNYTIADEEVLRLAGIAVGDKIGPATLDLVATHLRESGQFARVEVEKRYRSLSDDGDIAVLILVHEKQDFTDRMLVLPTLEQRDEDGFSYGVHFTVADVPGAGGRIGLLAGWGGRKHARLELEDNLGASGLRLEAQAGWSRFENRHDDVDDERLGASALLTRAVAGQLRIGMGGGLESVNYGTRQDRHLVFRAELRLRDEEAVMFPRHSQSGALGIDWKRVRPRAGGEGRSFVLPWVEGEIYRPLLGTTVVLLRGRFDGANGRLPDYERPLLGGVPTLRGLPPGTDAGDRRLAASLEWRVPLTSPVRMIQMGVRAFLDVGKAWEEGRRFGAMPWRKGYGLGLFALTPFADATVDVAHSPGFGVRAHVTAGLRF